MLVFIDGLSQFVLVELQLLDHRVKVTFDLLTNE